MNQKSNLLIYVGIFLLTTGVSFFVSSQLLPTTGLGTQSPLGGSPSAGPTKPATGQLAFEGPKVAACPINGQMYTKEEEAIWQTRRPLMVMIENHQDARPQSGLQQADIVYEAVAEGGITRFMGVFYCGIVAGTPNKYDVGPVRSARTYFLDLASEYSDYPLYNHVGGANCSAATPGGPCTTNKKALAMEQIDQYGWRGKGTWSDLNQFSLSYKDCRREQERTGTLKDYEHTVYCSTQNLWQTAASRGLTNITEVKKTSWDKSYRPWRFTQKEEATSSVISVSFDFWTGYKDYSVSWKYNQPSNSYQRWNAGVEHIDFNTKKVITAKNIVIQFAKESRSVDSHLHNLYEVIGSGKGVLIQNGKKEDITWSKANRLSRTIYKNASGQEVNFIPGNVWVEILPLDSKVNYESQN